MQRNPPGYPLPDGELGEDEIVCQLVFLPNRPEYWQAFLGAYHYLTTWLAWERDDDKRGKNAAANWREAFELTMGCWRMTCLEDLQNNVAAILALLQNQDPCCNENITYYDSTTYITIITPGIGDPPEFYGETAVEDWVEWREYLCHNANLWVDELIRAANTIEIALDTGGLTIGLLASLFGAVAFFIVGGVLALPLLLVVLFGLTANVSATIFAAAAVSIEDKRTEIICAILNGGDVAQAVEDALNSGPAWDLLYSHLDIESATAILYEGGDGETYLEAEQDESCVCGYLFELIEGDEVSGYQPLIINSELLPDGPYEFEAVSLRYKNSDTLEYRNVSLQGLSFDYPPGNEQVGSTYVMFDEDENVVWDSDSLPSFPLVCAGIRIVDERDDQPPVAPEAFNVTITWIPT